VVTSTSAPPTLRTELERALWSAFVTERTGRRVAERELAGARLELATKQRRVEALETVTSSLALASARSLALARSAPTADPPLMTTTGFAISAGVAVGMLVLGVWAGRESAGLNVLDLRGP
jgi:hypothetical protein